jgi:hypothetical protein
MNGRRIKELFFVIDTCLLNLRQRSQAVNQLEKWYRDGLIKLRSTGQLWDETKTSSAYHQKATKYPALFARSCSEADNEALCSKISEIIFPKGIKTRNDHIDVEAIFVAKMWGAIFVTNDGDSKTQPRGVLGSRDRLHREIGVQVMRPEEAVEIIKRRIALRDKWELQSADRESRTVADWCGKD